MLPDDKKWNTYAKDAGNFVASRTAGFSFDPTPVKMQFDSFSAVATGLLYQLNAGVQDPAVALKAFEHAWNVNGGANILAAYKEQITAFWAKQKS